MPASTPQAADGRERVLQAAFVCASRHGLSRVRVDDVAREAGVARATVYRWFPGGRDQLVTEAVAHDIERFLGELGRAVAGSSDLATFLTDAVVFARRAVTDHQVLLRMLDTEPEVLLPLVSVQAGRALHLVRGFVAPYVERERAAGRLRRGIDADQAADYLARMFLSVVTSPGGLDLERRESVRSVVRAEFLGGILDAARPELR